jgi:glycerol uptake facilitator-like aquaporin
MLLAAVVGSGIMGDRLADGNVAIALLANTLATGAALVVIILTFGPISGVPAYLAAQMVGAIGGVVAAHAMFSEPLLSISQHSRAGIGQGISEFVATFGLLSVIWACVRQRPAVVPFAVGAYITAAYWFTASTSFANPAVTIARSMTNTFTGIRPTDVPMFVLAQCAGATAATALFRWLIPVLPASADRVVVPHSRETV